MSQKFTLLSSNAPFKPFTYERFYKRWRAHDASHWTKDETSMSEDVKDWQTKLSPIQKEFLTNIFRFFTQGDVDIASAYYTQYLPFFRLPEVTMMMGAFAAREATHIDAYAHLIETLGMPESTYSEFLEYKEMKEKQEYLQKFLESRHLLSKHELSVEDLEHIATSIAIFSGFVEGVQLFSTFTMLLNFVNNGLMKGMGAIVTWSVNDESQHVDGMMDVFKTFLEENPSIRRQVVRENVFQAARQVVNLERHFIRLVFSKYDPKEFFGLTAEKLEKYIEFIADFRLESMGFEKIFSSDNNPIPELAFMISAPIHTNFFEATATDYANGTLTGKWSEVWG